MFFISETYTHCDVSFWGQKFTFILNYGSDNTRIDHLLLFDKKFSIGSFTASKSSLIFLKLSKRILLNALLLLISSFLGRIAKILEILSLIWIVP